ncbi:hypothetical protein MKW98_001639 [Papaver atlanticum]|uniref:Uncharacterized protein n=1 Tax=Papaver atlanticum TaxID=357466 RepID=A0AAD4S827_9MAGN|nr:hypothetical protein MKW98_001639 [Papaver atlanticum]
MTCVSLKYVPAASDHQLAPQAKYVLLTLFAEGIRHILSHWVTLVIEVADKYLTRSRGKFMSEKVKQLAADIFIWFAQSKDERKVKSVGYLIQETVRSKFKCSVGDGSTILVSTKLKKLHQDLVEGNLESIEELRQSTSWIGQGTFDRLKKDERKERRLQKRMPHLKITKHPMASSTMRDIKKTNKRHHQKKTTTTTFSSSYFGLLIRIRLLMDDDKVDSDFKLSSHLNLLQFSTTCNMSTYTTYQFNQYFSSFISCYVSNHVGLDTFNCFLMTLIHKVYEY